MNVRAGSHAGNTRAHRDFGVVLGRSKDCGEVGRAYLHMRNAAFGDAPGGMHVLAAGKAMGEQRIGARLAGRTIEQRGEILSLGIGKIETFSGNARLLKGPATAGNLAGPLD